jgi:hypothetical protein
MSLIWIPKGILEKYRRICFRFLWDGTQEQYVIPWVKWKKLSLPKALGGWGLNFFFLFSKAMVAKYGWQLLSTKILWTDVVHHKYIVLDTLEDWV